MNKNIYQSTDSSGGTTGKKESENEESFIDIVNQVLDKHRNLAKKNNENLHLQNALKSLQQELQDIELKHPGSSKIILTQLFEI